MWEVITQGQRVPDHQISHTSGTQHVQAVFLQCPLTKLSCARLVLSVCVRVPPRLPLALPRERQSPEEGTRGGIAQQGVSEVGA